MKKIIALSLICFVFLCGCNTGLQSRYTEKKLVSKCEFSNYDKIDINYRGIDCTYYEGVGLDEDSPYYGVKFYIFKSNTDAKEAFDTDVNDAVNYFIIEEQSNSDILYWAIENGGDVRRYEYVSENLLLKIQFDEIYYLTEEGNEKEREMTPELQEKINFYKTNF